MALPFLPMTLTCDGTDVSSKVVSVDVYEALYSPLRVEVTLQLNDKDAKSFMDKLFKLTLLDKPNVTEHKRHYMLHGKTEYHGYVTQERREWRRVPNGERIIRAHLVIESPLAFLRNSETFQIFYQKKLGDVFSTIIQAATKGFTGISCSTTDVPTFTPDYHVQYRENDLDFVLRLCQEHGVGFTQVGGKVEFKKGASLNQASKREVEYDGFSSWERIETQLSRTLHSRYLKAGEPHSKLWKAEKKSGKSTAPQYVETFAPEKSGEGGGDGYLQVMSDRLTHDGLGYVLRAYYDWEKKSGVFAPAVGLRAGDVIPGPPKEADSKAFLVEEVSWSFRREGEEQVYSFEAIARSKDTDYAPPTLYERPREHGFLRAVVIEPRTAGKADEDKLGRVKVQFLWDKESESTRSTRTCWVRLMTPYAGKKHGMYLMPEVEDEVLVAFEGGDVHQPVIIGSVHNRESEILKELKGALQLETLAFNTPKGVKARIWEKEGSGKAQQTVKLDLTDKIKVALLSEDEVDINVHSEGTAQLLAKKAITVTSEESIELICGDAKMKMLKNGTITIEGKDISIKGTNITNDATSAIKTSGQTVTVAADTDHKLSGTNVKVDAKANVNVTAKANVALKGTAKASLEGTAGVEVKSAATAKMTANAMAEVSSSGVTQVKGSLVKIN